VLLSAATALGLAIGILGGFYVFLLSVIRVGHKGYVAGTGAALIFAAVFLDIAALFAWLLNGDKYFNGHIVALVSPVFFSGPQSL
jgi:hypothetical protein